jgi:uncharacterized phage-associated protein
MLKRGPVVWDNPPDAPLFPERIEAWSLGPVVPELFAWHKGHFSVEADVFPNGDVSRLSKDQRETIDSVLASTPTGRHNGSVILATVSLHGVTPGLGFQRVNVGVWR